VLTGFQWPFRLFETIPSTPRKSEELRSSNPRGEHSHDAPGAKLQDIPSEYVGDEKITLVARYYRGVYRFALRITDYPLEAILLTHDAFNRTRKQLRNCRDEATIVRMLVAAAIQGLNARGFN
jgi:hypothetical protein